MACCALIPLKGVGLRAWDFCQDCPFAAPMIWAATTIPLWPGALPLTTRLPRGTASLAIVPCRCSSIATGPAASRPGRASVAVATTWPSRIVCRGCCSGVLRSWSAAWLRHKRRTHEVVIGTAHPAAVPAGRYAGRGVSDSLPAAGHGRSDGVSGTACTPRVGYTGRWRAIGHHQPGVHHQQLAPLAGGLGADQGVRRFGSYAAGAGRARSRVRLAALPRPQHRRLALQSGARHDLHLARALQHRRHRLGAPDRPWPSSPRRARARCRLRRCCSPLRTGRRE